MYITRDLSKNVEHCYTLWVGIKPKCNEKIWDLALEEYDKPDKGTLIEISSFTSRLFESFTGIKLEPGGITEISSLTITEPNDKN